MERARLEKAMHPLPINENPDDVWNETAQTVLKEIRSEIGIPDWLPKYLNGRDDFERRVMALIGRHGRPFSQADMKRKLSLYGYALQFSP